MSDAPAKPFCINCVSGFALPGEAKGSIEAIGPYDEVYVAKPSTPAKGGEDKAIIYFYDAFGLALKNNKILADTIAEKTGLVVYVPDLFKGGGIAEDGLAFLPQSVKEVAAQSLLQKATAGLKIAPLAPFFLKHRHATKYDDLDAFLVTLKAEKKLNKLGATGYCYGGKLSLLYNTRGLIDVSVACHPSMVNIKQDVAGLKGPTFFACTEYDPIFPESMRKQAEEALTKRGAEAPPFEIKTWENTVHGSFTRPKLDDPLIKQAFEEVS